MTPADSQTKIKVTLSPIEQPKSLSPADVSAIAQQIIANVEKVVVGKHEQVVLAIPAAQAAVLLQRVYETVLDRPLPEKRVPHPYARVDERNRLFCNSRLRYSRI